MKQTDEDATRVDALQRAKVMFDEHADAIARHAITHLKIHYPAALNAVPKGAETSLRNTIKAGIRSHFGIFLDTMKNLETDWDGFDAAQARQSWPPR